MRPCNEVCHDGAEHAGVPAVGLVDRRPASPTLDNADAATRYFEYLAGDAFGFRGAEPYHERRNVRRVAAGRRDRS